MFYKIRSGSQDLDSRPEHVTARLDPLYHKLKLLPEISIAEEPIEISIREGSKGDIAYYCALTCLLCNSK